MAQAQSPSLLGRWNVEITFANEEHRALRFDVQGEGKGTFLLLDPKARVWGAAKPSEAKWSQGEGNSVTFSGPVEFMLGNVGRDAGTLVFKGKFETESLITFEEWHVQSDSCRGRMKLRGTQPPSEVRRRSRICLPTR